MRSSYEWDPAKAARNLTAHGVSFDGAVAFEWATALVTDDTRRDYGEARKIASGLIGRRVHILGYTERGPHIRVISLRKTNDREVLCYVRFAEQESHDG